ncbi:MAG: hypothetical protein ACREE2_00930 [Stellaceae bacterium]
MISADLLGAASVLDRLRGLAGEANGGVARAVAKLGIDLQNHVQQDKLSGQVLAIHSGNLKSSIAVSLAQTAGSVTATVSSGLDYAAAQEYGFFGVVNVKASLRQIKEAFGRPISAKTISVAAHSRRMDLPARSFLRSALDDMSADIGAGIEDALRQAVS